MKTLQRQFHRPIFKYQLIKKLQVFKQKLDVIVVLKFETYIKYEAI